MGEEKNIGENENIVNNSGDTGITPVTEEKQQNTAENHGEHSHHHHHHSSSHHSGSHHHHHHHSSRRRHHRRHRSRKKNIFSRFKKFFKKLNNKKRISVVCALALAVILVFSVGLDTVQYILRLKAEKEANNRYENHDTGDVLRVDLINPDGALVTDVVQRYLEFELISSHHNVNISSYTESNERYDIQKPVAINISTVGAVASAYKIEFADNEGLKNARVDYLDASEKTYVFEHLYANTQYYYRVTAYTGFGVVSERGSFKTSDTPRFLTIDGIYKVRDIGNWQAEDGKRIKQGLLYRGTEMDGAVYPDYHLTDEGLYDMLDVLGVKFDMDLRSKYATPLGSDALGSRVTHKYYDMVMYSDVFEEDGKAKVKAIFTDLANKDNYPMYIHCTYGKDRTGIICYLLEALLGVSEGDCLKDYGLSDMPVSYILEVRNGLDEHCSGNNLKEKVEDYLVQCGVTRDQIIAIREIFLGE